MAYIESSKTQLRRKIEAKMREIEHLEELKKMSVEARHVSSCLIHNFPLKRKHRDSHCKESSPSHEE